MRIVFTQSVFPETGTVVVTSFEDSGLSSSAQELDKRMKGNLSRAIKDSLFTGKKASGLILIMPGGTQYNRIYVLGLGKRSSLNSRVLQEVGGSLYADLFKHAVTVTVLLDEIENSDICISDMAANLSFGVRLASFRFDKYRTKKDKKNKPKLEILRIASKRHVKAKTTFSTLDKVADGVFLARELISEPANVLNPATFAHRARAALEPLGVKVRVFGAREIEKFGMGALLGVAQGSANEPRLLSFEWNGPNTKIGKIRKSKSPIALVGKGVTFDSGGISLKPSAGMEEMKTDMGGAGVIVGLMAALAGRRSKAHVVGVVGLVENMPSGTAQRPGDIVTSMSGQKIEILNTDAEGRLVLADALYYCKETFKPRIMIDLATLTGAIVVCLGAEKAGLFSNDDNLAKAIFQSGEEVGERVWRLPLESEYDKLLRSDVADMKNIGERGAGAIVAAQFLKRFVGDIPWAHLDIAGVTWSKKNTPIVPKGGTGFGVRLLDRFIAKKYES